MSDFRAVGENGWRAAVERELDAGVGSLATELVEGFELAPLYTRTLSDLAGFPGLPPYIRGGRALPQRPAWQRCQRVCDPDVRVAAEQIAGDRVGGVEAIWLQLDRATRLGLDLDAADERRVAGDDGITVLGAGDLRLLLEAAGEGPLAVLLDAGGNTLPAAAALVAAIEAGGHDHTQLRLRLGCDPLGALLRDGELPASPESLLVEMAGFTRSLGEEFQRCRSFSVSVLPHAAAGAHAVQQLAAMAATVLDYLRWLEGAGLEPQVAVRQIDLILPMERDFLLGIAKLRAARLLWGKLLAACELPPAAPWIHAVAGERTLTRSDAWMNLLRVTAQVAAAGIAGADEITAAAFEERLGRCDGLGRRLARNTHAILAEESELGAVLDAAGGAHAVEALTQRLARAAWESAQEMDRAGGIAAVIHHGGLQDRIEEISHVRAERAETETDPVLGLSVFPPPDGQPAPSCSPIDRASVVAAARRRRTDLQAHRGDPLIEALHAAAYERRDVASVPAACRDAAEAGASLAEISEAVRPGAARARARALLPHSDEDLWLAAHGKHR